MRCLYPVIISALLLLLPATGKAQNLVPNGSFESAGCPYSAGAFANATGWGQLGVQQMGHQGCASAYLNQYPNSGRGFLSIMTHNGLQYQKGYVARDIPALTIGTKYEVSLSITLMDQSGVASSDFGALFYDKGPTPTVSSTTLSAVLSAYTPQIMYDRYGFISDTTNWLRVVDSFTADSAYDHIAIGGFGPPNSTAYLTDLHRPPPFYDGFCIYYVDSLVVKILPGIYPNFNDSSFCVGDTMKVPYTLNHSSYYDTANVFKLELSGPTGSFAAPTILDTLKGNNPGLLKYVIPSTITPGYGYRIRIKASLPRDSSEISSRNIVIGNTIPAKPVASNNGPVCLNNTLSLTANSTTTGVSYKWTGPNSFTSALQNPTIAGASLASAGRYIVTAVLYGCSSKDSTTAVVINATASSVASGNGTVCQNDTIKLSATITSGTATAYNWTGPDGFRSSAKDTFIARAGLTAAGNYLFAPTFASGCITNNIVNITVKPQPQGFSVTSNSPQCQGSTLSMLGNSTSTGVTWSWSGPGGYTNSSQGPSFSNAQPSVSGSYILTATLNGCAIKDTEVVSVIAIPPTPVPSANTPVCVGQSLNLDAGVTAPGYIWNGPGGFTNFTKTPALPNAGNAMAGTYNVRAVDGGCSSGTATINITVIPAPVASMYPSPKDSICQGATVSFFGSASNAGAAPAYTWYRNNSRIAGAATATYATITAADYDTYFCIVTSNGTCATPFTDTSNAIQLRVFPWLTPSVSISASPAGPVKFGDLVTFTATPVNGGNNPAYQWMRNNKNESGATSYTWGASTLSDKDVVKVNMTSSYQCPQPKTAASNSITVTVDATGIAAAKLMQGVKVYPDPFDERLEMTGLQKGAVVQLVDANGKIVMKRMAMLDKEVLHTDALTPGIYYLQLSNSKGERMSTKLVKQ